MITREEIIKQTNDALKKEFEFKDEQLLPTARLQYDLGLDSLDALDMVVVLEQQFGVTLRQDYDLRAIVTLNDLYDFIEKLAQTVK
ncbi:MAG: phosphopantetheine-binding protein [Elusimicrobiaceae bacterium]